MYSTSVDPGIWNDTQGSIICFKMNRKHIVFYFKFKTIHIHMNDMHNKHNYVSVDVINNK